MCSLLLPIIFSSFSVEIIALWHTSLNDYINALRKFSGTGTGMGVVYVKMRAIVTFAKHVLQSIVSLDFYVDKVLFVCLFVLHDLYVQWTSETYVTLTKMVRVKSVNV